MENIRLLLVDDEPGFRSAIGRRLKKRGIITHEAGSGKECLAILGNQDIDIVVLDIKMPGMDGIEVLQEIKKKFPLVEVIMLTGHGSTETAVKGMKLGAFDYLLKPASYDDLCSKLQGARKRKEEQEERIRKAELKLLLRRGGDL